MNRHLLIVLSSFALIACGPPSANSGGGGGGGGGGNGGGSVGTPSQIADSLTGLVCGWIVRCQSSRAYSAIGKSYGIQTLDDATCEQMMNGPGASINRLQAALEAETIVFNTDEYAACRTIISGASCQADLGDGACGRMFEGTVEVGGGCFIDEECVDGDGEGSCSADEAQCGVCSVRPVIPDASLGESCEEADCGPGLDCDENNLCAEDNESNAGGAGTTCDAEGGTDLVSSCDLMNNFICVNDTCTEAQFTSQAGDACGSNGVLCEGDLVCPIHTGGGMTQCTSAKLAGERCMVLDGQAYIMTGCVPTANCEMNEQNEGTCVAKVGVGEPCEDDDNCLSSSCGESGTCDAEDSDPEWRACP